MNRLLFIFLIGFTTAVQAQKYPMYWVEFETRDTTVFSVADPGKFLSQRSIQRRQKQQIPIDVSDIPVSPSHFKNITSSGYSVFASSKWMNALLVTGFSNKTLDSLKRLPGVKRVTYLGFRYPTSRQQKVIIPDIQQQIHQLEQRVKPKQNSVDTTMYGKSFQQIRQLQIDSLHARGWNGSGVWVAILDAGFSNAGMLQSGLKLFSQAQLILVRDFVDPGTDVYSDDEHGTHVWSCMAAYKPGTYIGTSPGASYLLLRTEDALHESKMEEALWIVAAEFADSCGVDLIQSSLGYNEFDERGLNYRHKDLDGKTALISKGAAVAVEKGIHVINSAGNEGDKDWRFIAAPADVPGVIAVGGVDAKGKLALFSSQGPTADKRIKPDVVAMGEQTQVIAPTSRIFATNGTSYASPIVAGMVTCLLQAYPYTLPARMLDALKMSSSLYATPDAFFGYGIPDATRAYRYLESSILADSLGVQWIEANYSGNGQFQIGVQVTVPQKLHISVSDTHGKTLARKNKKVKKTGYHQIPVAKKKALPADSLNVQIDYRNGTIQKQILVKP